MVRDTSKEYDIWDSVVREKCVRMPRWVYDGWQICWGGGGVHFSCTCA